MTAAGSGFWGDYPVTYALSTIRRTIRARFSREERSIDRYRFTFRLLRFESEFREFATNEEREAFVGASITEPGVGGPGASLLQGCAHAWGTELIGDRLVGVTFVEEEPTQLEFGRGRTNVEVLPTVRTASADINFGDTGYRDALTHLIGDRVLEAGLWLDGPLIRFESADLPIPADRIRQHPYREVVDGYGGDIWAEDDDEIIGFWSS